MSFNILNRIISLVLLLLVCATAAQAQTKSDLEQQARAIIQSKGLDETELRARLQQRGINIDQVEPEQLPQLQPIIEEVIREMEQEKALQSGGDNSGSGGTPAAGNNSPQLAEPTSPQPSKPAPQSSKAKELTVEDAKEIKAKVNEGVSIEEALSETVTSEKQEDLPAAKIWGQHLFRDKSLTVFRTTNEVKPPDSYILSTGDVITISVFGVSQFDSQFEINKEGYIRPSGMPKIFLKGIELGKAKQLLLNRFKSYYRFAPEQFAVSLTTARTISVNIFGETNNYGSFTISAINTAFNALVAAGGPSDIGSVRNIKVMRGKESKILDVYAFMSNPSLQYDFFLEDNDIIYVPVAERIVRISGAVRRPFYYELTKGEDLLELIGFAGGLNANAYNEWLQVKRFVNNTQTLIDVNLRELREKGGDFELRNGDEILVRTIKSPVDQLVSIQGSVEQPGVYALSETPRASGLLQKGLLKRTARTDFAFIQRKNADGSTRLLQVDPAAILAQPGGSADLLLEPQDKLVVYEKATFTDKGTLSVQGAVRVPVANYAYSVDSSITLQKAILLAGGLKPDATGTGYIVRTDPNNSKIKSYIPVNLFEAIRNPSSSNNPKLQPNDEVSVLSSPAFTDAAQVSVVGAVRTPGKFDYSPTLSLKDALLLSGGIKMEAARNRIDIYRVNFTENQPTRTQAISVEVDRNLNILSGGSDFTIQPYDEIVVRSIPDFEFQQFVDLNGEVKYPGRYALTSPNETLSSVVRRAGGLTLEANPDACTMVRSENGRGQVLTRLRDALAYPNSPEDHILKAGDVITIFKQEGLVTIRGQNTELGKVFNPERIANQINVAYRPNHRANWYIKEYAGGFDKNAQRKRLIVESPNGKITRTQNYFLFKVYPKVQKGDMISVPSKPPKVEKNKGGEGKDKKGVDWDKKLTQILAFTSMVTSSIIAYATVSKL